MTQTYNISIFTENTVGMLNRITIIFTRRHINIESITACESEMTGVHRYTIVVNVSLEQVKKVLAQIEKQIEVLKAFYHLDEDVIYQELALFKIPTEIFLNEGGLERLIRSYNIRVITIEKELVVLEKTGRAEEIKNVYEELKGYGLTEFARSGRVAISKPMKTLETHLMELHA